MVTVNPKGRPVSEIKPALHSAWSRVNSGNLTEPDLIDFAKKISAAVRVSFQRSSPVTGGGGAA